MPQKIEAGDHLASRLTGEARSAGTEGAEALTAKTEIESRAADWPSMEAIVERDNLRKALAQVKRNKGAPGIDGMTVEELGPYLKEHWLTIRALLLEGTYKPQPVRRVEIPKASGGTCRKRGLDMGCKEHGRQRPRPLVSCVLAGTRSDSWCLVERSGFGVRCR